MTTITSNLIFDSTPSYDAFFSLFIDSGLTDSEFNHTYFELCQVQHMLDIKKNTIVRYLSDLGYYFERIDEESCTVIAPTGDAIGVITPNAKLDISYSDFVHSWSKVYAVSEADIFEELSDIQTTIIELTA